MAQAMGAELIVFLSTPSARRATQDDDGNGTLRGISIHALREEGDQHVGMQRKRHKDFYPRPPRGGRPHRTDAAGISDTISIHALREEGDVVAVGAKLTDRQFLSTPSARRAT